MKKTNKIDLEILDNLIFGRVEPQIYAFTTQTIPNYLKVGDTYRPLEIRLNEWRKYYPNLEKKFDSVAKVDNETFFRDHAVHYFLETEIKKERLLPNAIKKIPYYSKEFFKDTSINDLTSALIDIKANHKKNENKYQYYKFDTSRIPVSHTYARNEHYLTRPNQQKTIDGFKKAINNGRNNLLMYAVMRFGKSFTSLCCAVEMKARIVLVVSAKADVKEEWKRTTESHIKFKEYSFLDSKDLLQSNSIIKEKQKAGQKIVIFLTLQDLQGDKIKSKHRELFNNEIDLLLIDETHFGARAEEYGKILRNTLSTNELKNELKLNDSTLDDLDGEIKAIKAKIRLHLSGTPYRILMNSEFTKEDIIAFYQFSNIAEDQESWDLENLHKDEIKEWDNPYYGFPKMIRFAFNPNTSSQKKMDELKKSGITSAFSELFKPKSVVKDIEHNLHKKFVHEKEIVDLFKVIDGTNKDENILNFLDYKKIKDGKMCRHIVCVLPFRASCDALEELIKKNTFKNLSKYQIINISGVDGDKNYKDTQLVQSKIKDYESKNIKTITLTVNRMLTGSTVPQWDTMLYFKDTSSPQEYDQAIFRLQNQYIREYKASNGDTVKYNMKPQTLLVDFNPNRMFQIQEQKSRIYNANIESNGNSKLEERIRRELAISPIIVLNKTKIVEIQPADIIDAVRQYSSNRSVLDEATSIGVDISLLNIKEIRSEIEKQNEIGSNQGLEIKSAEGEGDEIDLDDIVKEDIQVDQSDNKISPNEDDKQEDYKKRFAMYYARILFFAFLTDSQVRSLEEIINAIGKNKDNQRIVKNIGINKDILVLFQKYINPFILNELDYKIQNINTLSNDPQVKPVERVSHAMRKFSRLSNSEIVTPEFMADKIINSLPEKAITKSTKILDISSKQGEFVYSVYKKFGKGVASNFYSIPTSKIAYEFTRKVYRLLELDVEKIEKNYTSYHLVENDSLIKLNNVIINNINMKFDVIVGNPPYQKAISTASGNKSLSKQLFPEFIKIGVLLNPKYLSLITPSRWFTGDAQDKTFLKLREFFKENNHIQSIVNIPDSKKVFSDVEISGGVNYFLYNSEYQGDVEFTEYYNDQNFITKRRPLFEDGLDIILSNSFSYNILDKVRKNKNFTSLMTITKGRDAFGITGKNANNISTTKKTSNYYELRCRYEEIRYVDKKYITKNIDLADKWKIFISKGNGAAGLLTDNNEVSILGKPYLGKPKSVCTDSLIPIGNLDTEFEANALVSFIKTKFLRYLVGILKVSQNIYQNVYQFVPLQDFTSKSDINWKQSIESIDKQLYKKYKLTKEEVEFIENIIKPMN